MFNLYNIRCPKCGKIFKTKLHKNGYETDFGDLLRVRGNIIHCLKCEKSFSVTENRIVTEEWIADMIFKIKGN